MSSQENAELRQMIHDFAQALRAKDISKLMSFYAPDVRSFDLAPPLKYEGIEAIRQNWENWLPTFAGPVEVEIRDLEVLADQNVAFSHSIHRLSGKRTDGSTMGIWVRVTVGFRKQEGKWRTVHEHVSVPFYMDGSFKAAVDLQP